MPMRWHGYGQKTFKLETNTDNAIIFYLVKGRYSSEYYHQNHNDIERELPTQLTVPNNVTLVFVEGKDEIKPRTCGVRTDVIGHHHNKGLCCCRLMVVASHLRTHFRIAP